MNGSGQLGDTTTTDRWTPVAVSTLGSGVAQVSAGYHHTCAVTTGGEVRCWGENSSGQLGDGTTTSSLVPVVVRNSSGYANLTGIAMVACGNAHTCAVTTGGEVYCWGANSSGQLGVGDTTDRHLPTLVCNGPSCSGALRYVTQVDTMQYHTCARQGGGDLWCWGHNSRGQLGDNANTNRPYPVLVQNEDGTGVTGAAEVSTGFFFTCAAVPTRRVKCWGYNNSGQLGDGTTTERNGADWVLSSSGSQFTDAVHIEVGAEHSCAVVATDQALYCWGNNASGRLGDGSTTNRYHPVLVDCSD
jgi:alpha-tubulin suppressor-like RCC1 family protein